MACVIHTNLYDDDVLQKLQKDLTKKIESGNRQYGVSSKTIYTYFVRENVENRPCNIPFSYGLKLAETENIKIERPNRKVLGSIQYEFRGCLREEQKKCRDEALALLQRHKAVMLSCYTGFGKTVTAINMASKIKLKTFIIVPKKPLLVQWAAEVRAFLPDASVKIIEPRKIAALGATCPDVCVINACNIQKLDAGFLKKYGFVIVDEAHLQMTEKLSENLLRVTPRYLLGITATPYREDDYNALFKLFFGNEKISYSLQKKHLVYKVKTGFTPENDKYLKYGPNYKSKVDWNGILEDQAKNEKRNQLIINIITQFADRVFLVLVKRVEHGQYLMRRLQERGEKVTSLLGKQQEFDKDARILVGTNSKIGTGFDHPRLDTLLAAADMVSYYIQFIGRVMRRKDVEPLIFDLVDSHPTLKRHFKQRSKVYTAHGGQITNLDLASNPGMGSFYIK